MPKRIYMPLYNVVEAALKPNESLAFIWHVYV